MITTSIVSNTPGKSKEQSQMTRSPKDMNNAENLKKHHNNNVSFFNCSCVLSVIPTAITAITKFEERARDRGEQWKDVVEKSVSGNR